MIITEDNLGDVLRRVLHDEPPAGDAVAGVYRRAEAIRRRRLRTLIATGLASVVAVSALGYALATTVIPETRRPTVAALAGATATPEQALVRVRRAAGGDLRVVPREPVRGPGWRQYTVLERESGRPRGLIEVSVYTAPDGLCFPVLARAEACARADRAGDDIEYVRYSDDADVDWQTVQVIARRLSDGRVVAVQATGERGTGDRAAGRPPLTAPQAAALATDEQLMDAFGEREKCNGGDPACPLLKVPVPAPS